MKKLICIMCPIGCNITVTETENGLQVEGNTCKRGHDYAVQEVTSPMRVVTSLVKVDGGKVLSVKTDGVVPKDKIFDVLFEISKATASVGAKIGDVILPNVLGLGVNVVATSNI